MYAGAVFVPFVLFVVQKRNESKVALQNCAKPPARKGLAPDGPHWYTILARASVPAGGVAEWLKAPVLKTGSPQKGLGGSNPSPSVVSTRRSAAEIASRLYRTCRQRTLIGDSERVRHDRHTAIPRRMIIRADSANRLFKINP